MNLSITRVAVLILGLAAIGDAAEFQSEFISVGTEGSGPVVILLSGLASSPEVWSAVVDGLKGEYQLHLISVSGFAGSAAAEKTPESYVETIRDEVVRYVAEEKFDAPVLVGHSMGGLVALLVAGNEDAHVAKVVVVDTLPFFSLLFNPSATSELVSPQAAAFRKQLEAMNEEAFARVAAYSASILTKTADKRSVLEKWIKESDRKVYAQCMQEVMFYDARPELKHVRCPVTVIHAYAKEMPVQEEQLHNLYKRSYEGLNDVKVVQVSDSFHFVMWDNPQEFFRALTEALPRGDESSSPPSDKPPR
jgi:pimeloyl-ACP methyl ester carboxylesterase